MPVIKKIVLLSTAALFVGAAGGCASTDGATALADNDPNRVVCKSAPNTGSRIKKHDCRTVKEWDDVAAATDEINDAVRQRDTIRPRPVIDSSAKQQ